MKKISLLISLALILATLLSSCVFSDEDSQPKQESYYDFFAENEFSEVSNITLNVGPDGLSVMWGSQCTDTDIYFKERIVGIQARAFKGKGIRSVYLPNSIRWIQPEAFADCTLLTYIIIPKEIESIGKNAFNGCPLLTEVYFTGDEWDFRMINIAEGNEALTEANIHYNYTYPEIKEIAK